MERTTEVEKIQPRCDLMNPFVIQLGQIFTPYQQALLAAKNDQNAVNAIAKDFVRQFLLDVKQQVEIYMSHNVTTAASYFTSQAWLIPFIEQQQTETLYTFFKAIFLLITQRVQFDITPATLKPFAPTPADATPEDDEEDEAMAVEKVMNLPPQSLFSIAVILSGVFKSYTFSLLRQSHDRDQETKKVIKINQIIDVFNTKESAEFRKLVNEFINTCFSTLATYKHTFQHTLASYCSFFFTASPVLTQEFLKVAKPLGKTFLQSQPQLTTLLLAARTVKSYQQYSPTYHTVLRSNASAWYVADIVTAAVAPKESTYTAYRPLFSLFTKISDVSLPEGVTADIYNPDVIQSMLKALRIRPAVAVGAATHFLTNTLSTSRNQSRVVLNAAAISGFMLAVAAETKQTDATRKQNGIALYQALLQHIQTNNNPADLALVAEVWGDIIYQRNSQTMPIAPDQKLSLLEQIDTLFETLANAVVAGPEQDAAKNATANTMTSSLLYLFGRETNKDTKIKIITTICDTIKKFNNISEEFITIMIKTFTGVALTSLEDVTTYSTMLPIFIYNICVVDEVTQENPTFTAVYNNITTNGTKDALLQHLLGLITFSASRPTLFSSLLAYVLFYLAIVYQDKVKNNKEIVLPAEMLSIFGANSPFLTIVPFNTTTTNDITTMAAVVNYLAVVNNDLMQTTTTVANNTTLLSKVMQNTPQDDKAYNKYIGLFYGAVNFALFCTQKGAEEASKALTRVFAKLDVSLNIWNQLAFYKVIYKIQTTPDLTPAKYLGLAVQDAAPVTAVIPKDEIVSEYTSKLLPAVFDEATPKAYNRFNKAFFVTITPSTQTGNTLTQAQSTTILSALLLASHPFFTPKISPGANNTTVQQLTATVEKLYQAFRKNNNTIDYAAALGNKVNTTFIQQMLYGDSTTNTTGFFFTPIAQNNNNTTPDLANFTKLLIKAENSTVEYNKLLTHTAIVFAAYYSKVSTRAFHQAVIPQLLTVFKANYTKMFTLLQPYHMAVWNTFGSALCSVEEPKDLYDDEIEAGSAATSPKDANNNNNNKKGGKKDDKAALSPADQQKAKEQTIRNNITNAAQQPMTIICGFLDYLVYTNKNYARDELLFSFYQPVLQAMAGVPIKTAWQLKKQQSAAVQYEEVYTITIYKQICLPLLLSFCHSIDGHFSDDNDHVALLKKALQYILTQHDHRTNNVFKMALYESKNIDLSKQQKTELKQKHIDALFIIVDCLKQLSVATKSLYFTPSSLSFIMPVLTLFNDNIDTIISSMNVVEKKKAVVDEKPAAVDENGEPIEDDEDDDSLLEEDEIMFSTKKENKKYLRETVNTALFHALVAISTILSNHAKPASTALVQEYDEAQDEVENAAEETSSNTYEIDQMFATASNLLNSLGTTKSLTTTTLTNIPSTTSIHPATIVELLMDTVQRLTTSLDLITTKQYKHVSLFDNFVLSPSGLLSGTLPTRLGVVKGLEKSKLLNTLTQPQTAPQKLALFTPRQYKLLITYLYVLRYDTDNEVASTAFAVFNKYNLGAKMFALVEEGKTLLQVYFPELLSVLVAQSAVIRRITSLAIPYLLLTAYTKTSETTAAEQSAAKLNVEDLYNDIVQTHDKLLTLYKQSQDVLVKKQNIRDQDKYISYGYKRSAAAQGLLGLATLFAPPQPNTTATSAEKTVQCQYDFSALTAPLVQNTEKYYIPLLSKFMTTVSDVLIKDQDYDVWDKAVYVGSALIHTHCTTDLSIELISNTLQEVLKKCEGQKGNNPGVEAQKEGVVVLFSALSHYLTQPHHQTLLQQIFDVLIKTVQTTAEPAFSGNQTPSINSVQKTIHSALVTISKQLPRDLIIKYFQQHFTTVFTTKIFAQRIASILVVISVVKAFGGGFLMKETTLLPTLNAVLTINQQYDGKDGSTGPKLDKKQLANLLNECTAKIPKGGDKNSNVVGTLSMYYYLFTFLPQQMAIQIPAALPKILVFFGYEQNTRDLTHNLAQVMMRCASQNIPSGAKIILPLLLTGLREAAAWRTKISSLQLLSTIVTFSSKDLSTVLPSIIPRLIDLRRDPNPEVSGEAAKVLDLLSSVVKNPQIKKIATTLVNALHHTNATTVTKALEALYTTVFMHYVDPIALAVLMPIVFYGLTPDRASDVKKVAVQIAGSVSMITSDLNDISPYIGKLLNMMQITLMDSTPEVRNVTAKAIHQMVQTQLKALEDKGADDASAAVMSPAKMASKQLLSQFDTLLQLLLDILSMKRVAIPSPNTQLSFAADGTTAVQRSGCCFGASQLIHTKGIDYADELYESTILEALSSRDPIIREGFTELMMHLPQVFGQDFAPLVVKTLPVVVGLLGDAHPFCRDYAQQSSQTMVQLFARVQTQDLLATILEALVDSDYRVRTGSSVLAACFLLRLAGIEGELTIAEAEDEAVNVGKLDNTIRDKTAITTEQQELEMLDFITVDNRNEIYSSLFLMCSDFVPSVSIVANRVFKAVTPSMSRMLVNILPRLVERLTADLASSDDQRKFTAGKSLSDLVHKLGDRILRDIVPILLDKFNSIDVYTRSGICLGFSQIFLTATKGMLSPYNPDIFPLLLQALGDRDALVRESAKEAFANFCRAITTEKVVEAVIPELLAQIDRYNLKYEELLAAKEDGTSTINWRDDVFDDHPLYRYRHMTTHQLYNPADDVLSGLQEIVSIATTQRHILDRVIPYFLRSPVTQYHVQCIATITQVCGKSFNNYLDQVLGSLAQALSAHYNEYYNENDFEFVHEAVERYGEDEETEEEYQHRVAQKEQQLVLHDKLVKKEQDLISNAFTVFVGLAPQNYFDILELLFGGLSNSNYLEFEDQCAWLKMMAAFWGAIGNLNGMSNNAAANLSIKSPQRSGGYRTEIDLDDFGINTTQSLHMIISFFVSDLDSIVSCAADALNAFLNSAHPDVILKYITFIRTQFNDITGKSRKAPYARKIPELSAFNNKELVTTLFSLSQHGVVTLVSQPTIRTQCSTMLYDVADLITPEGFAPHAMKLVGFLIRTFPDKLSIDIKANILSTISLLLKKCSPQLKAFQTQLKTLLTKTLLFVDEKQEAAAKPMLNASGQVIVAAVDNRNVIVESDILCERAAYTMSFLAQPQSIFGDLVQAVLVHQHKIVAGKIAKAITQILTNRAIFETLPKNTVVDNISKLLPTLHNAEAHDQVRIEVSRIIGLLISLIPLEDAYSITANILAACQIPVPPFPQSLVDRGLTPPPAPPAPLYPPAMKTRQSTAMVLSSVLISSQDFFLECVGLRPAVQFIARGFKDTEELSLTAVVRFAGRLLTYAAKNQHENQQLAQIVRMLTQELLNLVTTTQCNTENVLVAVLSQVKAFVEMDYDAANDLMNVIVPLCIRARVGATKNVRKEIDIILHYTLLFNEDMQTGLANAQELATNLSKADATEFIDMCKRSVCKAVEKKKDEEEDEWQM